MRRRNGEQRIGCWSFIAVVLAGCGDPPPEPTPVAPAAEAPKPPPSYPFRDSPYVVDSARWKTTAWTVVQDLPADDARVVFRAAESSVPDTGGRSALRVSIAAYAHWLRQGHTQTPFILQFRSWGKSVPLSQVDEIAKAHYENWIREGVDIIKDRCRASAPTMSAGPARFSSRAIGTDATSRVREYRSWFVWPGDGPDGAPHTYVATFVAAADPGDDRARDDAAFELMRSIRRGRRAEEPR
jgi:hypothetical protein